MKTLLLVLLLPLLLYSEDFIFKKNTIGIEISPIRLILQDSNVHTFSGGFSYFSARQNAELHFPIYIEEYYDEKIATFDAEYRKFIDKYFYLGGLFRVARLWGGQQNKSTIKLGLGASAGYRFVFDNSFYYGLGVSLTKYITGKNHFFGSGGIDMTGLSNDTHLVFELEFLKIGYAF